MPAYANPAAPRPGDVAGTLRLLACLALAVVLIVLDHRGGWLTRMRASANVAVQPLWQLAGLPSRLGQSMRNDAATRAMLADDNRRLRNELLVLGARQARLQVEAQENARLRGLLGAAERGGLEVQLAPILDIDLDPARQRLVLDAGSGDGVRQGQTVIDAGGVLGQIIAVTPGTATVLLLTDLDHAVPVTIARSGVRLVAYGIGRTDRIEVRNIPLSSDVREGDVVVTSGLGGRFPPGFPVGTVVDMRPDDSHAFLVAELEPAAQLDRGRDVLLLNESRDPGPGIRDSGKSEEQRETGVASDANAADNGEAGLVGGEEATGTSRASSPEPRIPQEPPP